MKLFLFTLLGIISFPALSQVTNVNSNQAVKTDYIRLYRLKNNSVDSLQFNRIVLVEVDSLSFIGEPIGIQGDTLLMFKSKSYVKSKQDSIYSIDLHYVAGIGYYKKNQPDKYMVKFRKKGALLSNLPAYIFGGLGVGIIASTIIDRHFANFIDDKTSRSFNKIAAASISLSIGYTAFNYFFHRSKIKYYDINAKWSMTPMKTE
jgi:hypothetical protein